ncbi:MAG: hypothetical protein WA459_01585 [Stellaceae bacterium]
MRDKHGKPKTVVVTERDIERIFLPLARYRYLPVDYLHAFAGGSLDYLVNRLALLARKPNCYLMRPVQQRANASANSRRQIYELSDKAFRILHEWGLPLQRTRTPTNFAHELMTSQLMASFELGCRETGHRLLFWHDILQSQSLPEETRLSTRPHLIPVTVTIDGTVIPTHVAADGAPFGIARSDGDKTAHFFCPGVEADCGTEPIAASDFQRSSLYKKFVLYLEIDAKRIYRSHFGFPNLLIPIVTTNASRLTSMMSLLERLTYGAGSRNILFKTFPAFTSFEAPPPPSGQMLTQDWQRVGHPPFNFLTS